MSDDDEERVVEFSVMGELLVVVVKLPILLLLLFLLFIDDFGGSIGINMGLEVCDNQFLHHWFQTFEFGYQIAL